MATIWWIRRDLRLDDNPALLSALRRNESVVPVYIHDPESAAPWKPGAASQWWLQQSLESLDQQLQQHNSRIHYFCGEPEAELRQAARRLGAERVVWNALYEPFERDQQTQVERALAQDHLACESFAGHTLRTPGSTLKSDDTPYRVFTPFYRAFRRSLDLRAPSPSNLPDFVSSPLKTLSLDETGLLREHGWHQKLQNAWSPGEPGAWRQFESFLDDALARYAAERDYPARDATSTLSAALHFGEISIRRVWSALDGNESDTAEKFRSELGWREFSQYLMWHFPDTIDSNFNPRFDQYPWKSAADDPDLFRAWTQGRTGVELVDAGMRELWETGYMHNRVRMICASFLTKNLGFHWREGAAWFWDTLVDADLANNTAGWQWAAGCGADAAPFFRIFNPDTQAQKFDPERLYRKRWLPPSQEQTEAVIPLKESREKALAAYNDHIKS